MSRSKKPVMTALRRSVLTYVRLNAWCSIADIDRACRTARGGHAWVYAAVNRMLRAGMLHYTDIRPESRKGNARGILLALDYVDFDIQ